MIKKLINNIFQIGVIGLSLLLATANSLSAASKVVTVDPSTNKLQIPSATNFKNANNLGSTDYTWIYIDMSPAMNPITTSLNTNYLSSSQGRIFVPFDVELKVVDNTDGSLVYWLSTCYGCDSYNYFYVNNSIRDDDARVYILARPNGNIASHGNLLSGISGTSVTGNYDRPIWIPYDIRRDGSNFRYKTHTTLSSIYAYCGTYTYNAQYYGIGGILIIPGKKWQDKGYFNTSKGARNVGGSSNNSYANRYSVIYLRISATSAEEMVGGYPSAYTYSDNYWRPAQLNPGSSLAQ